MPPAARITWIDFCRVYTAFFVIVRHVDRWFVGVPTINYLADLFNFRSLIFFFFLMSGYFSHRPTEGQWVDVKRTKQLIIPYIFWCLFGMLVVYSPSMLSGGWSWLTPYKVASELGLTSWCYWNFTNVPLWFLRTLILLAFFAPLIHRVPSKVLIALVLISFAASDVLCDVDLEANESHRTLNHAQKGLPFRTYESELALGFFAGGILLRRYAKPEVLTAFLRSYALVPVLGSLVLLFPVLTWTFYPPVQSASLVLLGVCTTMSIGCLCERYLPRFTRAVASLGTASFFIYVTHYPILLCFRYALTGSWHGGLPVTLCYFLPFIILAVSVSLFFLLKKLCPSFLRIFAMAKV